MDLREVGYDDRDWINLAQDRTDGGLITKFKSPAPWRHGLRALTHERLLAAKVDCKKQSVCRRHEGFFDGRSSRNERLCSRYGRCMSSVPAAVELQKLDLRLDHCVSPTLAAKSRPCVSRKRCCRSRGPTARQRLQSVCRRGQRSCHLKLPSICSYWVEGKPRKNLNQVTCPDRESNPGHLVSRPDALVVTPQVWTHIKIYGPYAETKMRAESSRKYVVCLKSSVNGVISEWQLGACACAYTWFFRDFGRIDTQHAIHVTGSVNRLRPVERSQCERKCHSTMEQRVNIKFCYKLGKTATETHGMLVQVYGREAVSRKCVYEWFKRFREGKETIEDEPRSGRPSTSRTPEMIEKVRQMLAQDRRLTLRLIAEELDISKDTIVRDDFGKRKIYSRFVPHKLIDEQKAKRNGNFW
ncbi:hypothetical protein ANN_08730 [Periplaneta americana]|uniref:Mos1 transposase HTH domain-containing protein n=1 Tax=Periplaneta americana TaxID=6978 RepID=A0ABQ8T3W4_PERAM|nr:hypothetical protein ANN_08730 [Periplaneta americana]